MGSSKCCRARWIAVVSSSFRVGDTWGREKGRREAEISAPLAFLRNSHRHCLDLGWLENISERLRPSLEIGEDTLAIALFVIGRAGICVVHPMANSIVKENCDFSSCRCDRFCLSDPRRQAAIKSSQCRLCPTDRRRRKPQQRGGTISRWPCPRRQDLTS